MEGQENKQAEKAERNGRDSRGETNCNKREGEKYKSRKKMMEGEEIQREWWVGKTMKEFRE